MSAVDLLLSRLEGVRQTHNGWRAFCPAHQLPPHQPGRGRTLSVALGNGGVLVHCHAGCGAADILQAVGLELVDLFDRPTHHRRGPINDGPAAWASAAAQADVVVEIASRVTVGDLDALLRLT